MTLLKLIEREGLQAIRPHSEIAKRLNKKQQVPNPESQGQVPDLPTMEELQAIVLNGPNPQADLAAIAQTAVLAENSQSLAKYAKLQNAEVSITELIDRMVQRDGLSEVSASDIKTRLQQTQPDPNWQAYIENPSLAEAAGLGQVSAAQVMRALA